MTLSRHQRRILLVQAIFLWEQTRGRRTEHVLSREDSENLLKYIWKNSALEGRENAPDDFDRERFFGVIDNALEIQTMVSKHAPQWPLEKIAGCDRAVLYLAVYELLHTDVPAPVVMNEAIELAKDFGSERSGSFVNGVLSSLVPPQKP